MKISTFWLRILVFVLSTLGYLIIALSVRHNLPFDAFVGYIIVLSANWFIGIEIGRRQERENRYIQW